MSEKAAIGSEIEVTDSILDRNYWVDRPWVSPASAVNWQGADVLVVPWEAFREGRAALFSEGTSDLVRPFVGNSPLRSQSTGTSMRRLPFMPTRGGFPPSFASMPSSRW